MIWKGRPVATLYYVKSHTIHKIGSLWRGGRLVWQAVRSCFGSGIWRQEKPWLSDEKWKTNN